MVVTDEMKNRMHERGAPGISNHRRAEHDVAELTRHSCQQLVAAVDRERERIRFLVDAEMLALEVADLLRIDELKAELASVDSVGLQDLADQIRSSLEVEILAGTVRHLDFHHRSYFRRA